MMRQAISGIEQDHVEDFTQLWMEVLMQCFDNGLVKSASCIRVTRDHLRL